MKILIRNVATEMAKLSKAVNKAKRQELLRISTELKTALAKNTPVDTGEARDSWRVSEEKDSVVVSNTAEHIAILNAGHSAQAPAYFVESTALQFGKPDGTIIKAFE